jgi:hypothetical protein
MTELMVIINDEAPLSNPRVIKMMKEILFSITEGRGVATRQW